MNSHRITRPGRWIIFAGLPFAVLAVIFTITDGSIAHAVGQNAEPYVLFFGPVAIILGGRILYGGFPKQMVIPVGITGWVIGILIMYWYFWVGPGALKFSNL